MPKRSHADDWTEPETKRLNVASAERDLMILEGLDHPEAFANSAYRRYGGRSRAPSAVPTDYMQNYTQAMDIIKRSVADQLMNEYASRGKYGLSFSTVMPIVTGAAGLGMGYATSVPGGAFGDAATAAGDVINEGLGGRLYDTLTWLAQIPLRVSNRATVAKAKILTQNFLSSAQTISDGLYDTVRGIADKMGPTGQMVGGAVGGAKTAASAVIRNPIAAGLSAAVAGIASGLIAGKPLDALGKKFLPKKMYENLKARGAFKRGHSSEQWVNLERNLTEMVENAARGMIGAYGSILNMGRASTRLLSDPTNAKVWKEVIKSSLYAIPEETIKTISHGAAMNVAAYKGAKAAFHGLKYLTLKAHESFWDSAEKKARRDAKYAHIKSQGELTKTIAKYRGLLAKGKAQADAALERLSPQRGRRPARGESEEESESEPVTVRKARRPKKVSYVPRLSPAVSRKMATKRTIAAIRGRGRGRPRVGTRRSRPYY